MPSAMWLGFAGWDLAASRWSAIRSTRAGGTIPLLPSVSFRSHGECSLAKLVTNSSSDGRRDGEYTISIWESSADKTRNRMPISAVALPFSTCEIHRRVTLALAASSACVSPSESRSPCRTAPRSVDLPIWGCRVAGPDSPSDALVPPCYQHVPVRVHRPGGSVRLHCPGAPGREHTRHEPMVPSAASEHVETCPSTMWRHPPDPPIRRGQGWSPTAQGGILGI